MVITNPFTNAEASSSHLPNLFPSKKYNASNELYIILDNSFSMQAKGQKELLKRAVQELLEDTLKLFSCFSLFTNLKAIGTLT
jgi:hypothetical protein